MGIGASNTVRLIQTRHRQAKRLLNTRVGTLAVLGGLCLGLVLTMCWSMVRLALAPESEHVILAGDVFVPGLFALFPASLMVAVYFMPVKPPLTTAVPPRCATTWIVALTTMLTFLLLVIGFAVIE